MDLVPLIRALVLKDPKKGQLLLDGMIHTFSFQWQNTVQIQLSDRFDLFSRKMYVLTNMAGVARSLKRVHDSL